MLNLFKPIGSLSTSIIDNDTYFLTYDTKLDIEYQLHYQSTLSDHINSLKENEFI